MKKLLIIGAFLGCISISGLKAEDIYMSTGPFLKIYCIPNGQPKFKNMIIRFDPETLLGRWECEFGVETATATIGGNLIVESVGCEKDPSKKEDNLFIKVSSVTPKYFNPYPYFMSPTGNQIPL